MKADNRQDLRETQLPLLQICTDHVIGEAKPIDRALEELIENGLTRIYSPDREALQRLFLGTGRWEPLAQRGAAAASELGVTYDALRRRNKEGHRRIDALLDQLARSILDITSLEELLFDSHSLEPVPDPGGNVFERASIFLSYSRDDDHHEGGFISALRETLIAEFRFQTGQDLFVFQDKANIDLGENWRRKLEVGIDTTSFLLVILTPSYLRSAHCREELERFLQREKELGRDDLILPVYYGSIPENSADELTKALLERQYVDWRNLRFQSFGDIPVRMAVATLATSVASALSRTTEVSAPRPVRHTSVQDLGLLERLAEMELAMPRLLRGVLSLSAEQEGVTEETQQATEEMSRLNQMGRGSTARLIVARRLSSRLEPYADRMEESAQAIRSDLDSVELGISAMAKELPTSSEEGIEDVTKALIESMQGAQIASEQASVSVTTMGESYSEAARSASSLRPVLQRLLGSARVVAECAQRFATWIGLLEDALDSRARGEA